MDTHLVEQEEEEVFLAEPGVSDPWIDSCCLDETVCGSAYLPRCRLHSPCTGRIHSKRTGLSLAVILQSDVYEVLQNYGYGFINLLCALVQTRSQIKHLVSLL